MRNLRSRVSKSFGKWWIQNHLSKTKIKTTLLYVLKWDRHASWCNVYFFLQGVGYHLFISKAKTWRNSEWRKRVVKPNIERWIKTAHTANTKCLLISKLTCHLPPSSEHFSRPRTRSLRSGLQVPQNHDRDNPGLWWREDVSLERC